LSAAPARAVSKVPVLDQRPEVPLAFVPNAGQWPDDVRFALGAEGFGVTLKDGAILFHYADAETPLGASPDGRGRRRVSRYRTGSLEMKLVGGVLRSPVGLDARPGTARHVGADGAELSLSRHGRVAYQDVYPGIDLVFRAHDGLVEYDFEVAPGADASRIELDFEGGEEARLEGDGSLVIPTPTGGSFRHGAPVLDQDDGRGGRAKVRGSWLARGRGRLGFDIGPHDKRRRLRIDPTVVYNASGGSSFRDRSSGIARDAAGNVYLAYQRFGTGGTTPGAWIAKFDPSGAFVTETSFGGACVGLSSIAVDAAGEVYVAGGACGPIPLVNAYQSTLPPSDVLSEVALVARLRPDLSVAYATYFGGTQPGLGYSYVDEYALDVAAGAAGRVAISGWSYSADLPTPNGYQTSNTSYLSAFAAVFDTTASGASSLVYSTYLGSALGYAEGKGVAVDPGGNVYVTGYDAPPSGTHFPTKNGFQDVPPAGSPSYMDDAFLARLDPTKTGAESLVYSTVFGGTGSERGTAVAVDGAGHAYVVGFTRSNNLPTTPGVYRTANPDATQTQVFVAKFDTAAVGGASRSWATYVGPGSANGLAIDPAGRSFVVGQTTSPAFPTTADAIPPNIGYSYIFALDPSASALAYSTRLAGTAGFPADNSAAGVAYDETTFTAYVAGHTFGTTSSDLFVIGVRHPFEDARIEILPTTCDVVAAMFAATSGPVCNAGTTRWRPQRDVTTPIKIELSSTKPLKAATINITGPVTVTPIEAIFDPANSPNPYKVDWMTTDGAGKPLPPGDYKVNVVGQPDLGDPIGSEPKDYVISLIEVKEQSLRIERLSTNAALETNPGPGAGLQIFPEADDPGGQVGDRDKVRIVAEIFPAVPDPGLQGPVKVYFRGVDVDDPSANGTPIDDETQTTDNCRDGGCQVPGVGRINGADASAPVAVEVPNGQDRVTAEFQVSDRQGDNYRVVASTSDTWIGASNVTAKQSSASGEVIHASGEPLSGGTHFTEMLTVWRTLHLEADRLDSSVLQQVGPDPTGQNIILDSISTITALRPQRLTDTSTRFTFGPPHSDHGANDSWAGADLWPNFTGALSGTPVQVFGNSLHDLHTDPASDLTALTAVGNRYRLSDDRDVTLTGRLPFSLTSTLLAHAYIATKPLIGVDDVNFLNVTFRQPMRRNLTDAELAGLRKEVASSPSYWAILSVDAFEGRLVVDNDPIVEPAILGVTPAALVGRASAGVSQLICQDGHQPIAGIFRESIRDVSEERSYDGPELLETVTAHEIICHGMRIGHTTDGLCALGASPGAAGRAFVDDYVAELRMLKQPTVCVERPCPPAQQPSPLCVP